jgi:hypothetical protein
MECRNETIPEQENVLAGIRFTIRGDQMLAVFLHERTSKDARVWSPVDVLNVIDKRRSSTESFNPDSHQSDKER